MKIISCGIREGHPTRNSERKDTQ